MENKEKIETYTWDIKPIPDITEEQRQVFKDAIEMMIKDVHERKKDSFNPEEDTWPNFEHDAALDVMWTGFLKKTDFSRYENASLLEKVQKMYKSVGITGPILERLVDEAKMAKIVTTLRQIINECGEEEAILTLEKLFDDEDEMLCELYSELFDKGQVSVDFEWDYLYDINGEETKELLIQLFINEGLLPEKLDFDQSPYWTTRIESNLSEEDRFIDDLFKGAGIDLGEETGQYYRIDKKIEEFDDMGFHFNMLGVIEQKEKEAITLYIQNLKRSMHQSRRA